MLESSGLLFKEGDRYLGGAGLLPELPPNTRRPAAAAA